MVWFLLIRNDFEQLVANEMFMDRRCAEFFKLQPGFVIFQAARMKQMNETGGGVKSFNSPFGGDTVLFLKSGDGQASDTTAPAAPVNLIVE